MQMHTATQTETHTQTHTFRLNLDFDENIRAEIFDVKVIRKYFKIFEKKLPYWTLELWTFWTRI